MTLEVNIGAFMSYPIAHTPVRPPLAIVLINADITVTRHKGKTEFEATT